MFYNSMQANKTIGHNIVMFIIVISSHYRYFLDINKRNSLFAYLFILTSRCMMAINKGNEQVCLGLRLYSIISYSYCKTNIRRCP